MRIEGLRAEDVAGGRRARATVVWEGRHRGPTEMWFETDAAKAEGFEATPEAFALAAMPCAVALGEPRLAIEGALDTRLAAGFSMSMAVLSRWYSRCRVLPVEASGGLVARLPVASRRSAAFLSGGVDSLSLLRSNRLEFPLDHALAVRDGLFLVGWNTYDWDGDRLRPDRSRGADEQYARLERLGEATGFGMTRVRTNVRTFHPGYEFTKNIGFGAGMIAAAHCFPRRWSDVWFASSGHGSNAPPHASHALLDGHHSSGAIEVHHAEPYRLRMEKLATVAGWDAGLEALQVCLQFEALPPGRANCGTCEKCRRTMLGLVALGAADRATSFPRAAIDADFAAAYRPVGVQQHRYSAQVADALEGAGRADLAASMREPIRRAMRRDRWRRMRRSLLRWLRPGARSAHPR